MMKNHTFTKSFVDKFKSALIETYQYEEFEEFLIVPSILGKNTYVYLPLVSYTDITNQEAEKLKNKVIGKNYQIRALNFDYGEFKELDTVTMRLIFSQEKSLIAHYKSRTRGQVRKALKYGYTLKEGFSLLDDFYNILRHTYKKHGTPIMSKELIKNLYEVFKTDLHLFVLYKDGDAAATMLIFQDKELAWYLWGGVNDEYANKLAGYAVYHLVMEKMREEYETKIFDFGRSGYGSGTYFFKSRFNAQPIKIDIIEPEEKNIYSKYALVTKIYRHLPYFITDRLGPFLNKYLADR